MILEKSGRTVLLVDDEAQLRRLMNSILQRNGFTVLTASNGTEAERIAGQHNDQIDLLLADMEMPGMTGVELADRLKKMSPSLL